MRVKKPVLVLTQIGISETERHAVIEGAREMVQRAGMGRWMPVLDGRRLSIARHIKEARATSERGGQFSAFALLQNAYDKPLIERPHYCVLMVRDDVYAGQCNFVVGLSVRYVGSVVSIARFRDLQSPWRDGCVKTVAMHEIGHAFGLISRRRRIALDMKLGRHCANRCVMRQGVRVPDDWLPITRDRLEYGALCVRCTRDLQLFFEQQQTP